MINWTNHGAVGRSRTVEDRGCDGLIGLGRGRCRGRRGGARRRGDCVRLLGRVDRPDGSVYRRARYLDPRAAQSLSADPWSTFGTGAGIAGLVLGSFFTSEAVALAVAGLTALSVGSQAVTAASNCGYSGWNSGISRQRPINVTTSFVATRAADTVRRTAISAGHVARESRQVAKAGASWTSLWTYTYDGDGLRATAADTDGTSRTFLWDVEGEIPLLLGDGAARYVHGPTGSPVAQHDDEHGWLYLHGDVIGSVRAVTDADAATVAATDYTPYGTPVGVAGVALVGAVTAFGFAGEYTDPTGLVYLRARYLDPATAQFLSVDPLFDVSLSLYGYTHGNPLMFVDPLGLIWYQPWTWTADTWANIGVGAGVAALVVGAIATGGVLVVVTTGLTALSIGAGVMAGLADCAYHGWTTGVCRDRGVSAAISAAGAGAADTVKKTAMSARHGADRSRSAAKLESAVWSAAGTVVSTEYGSNCR